MTIGPYEILGEVGRGAMGVVYRARHGPTGRVVALKVVAADRLGNPQAVARLHREARAAARLAGLPGLVAVHDVGEGVVDGGLSVQSSELGVAPGHLSTVNSQLSTSPPVLYLAMDLIEARPLSARLAEGRLPAHAAAALLARAARAAHLAHEAGVIHRDLKPSNILVAGALAPAPPATGAPPTLDAAPPSTVDLAALTVWITDFGVAEVRQLDQALTRLTGTDTLLGTPAYMAPEQVRSLGVDARADVYALGATLYECLTGAPPFDAPETLRVLQDVLGRPPEPPGRRVAGVPPELDRIVLACLAKAPEHRYPTALALAEDLERFGRGASVRAPARALSRRLVRPAAWLGVGGALAGAIALGFTWAARARATASALAVTADAHRGALDARRLSAAYVALATASAAEMRLLEDHWHGAIVSHDRVDAAIQAVRDAAKAVAAQHPDLRLPKAWYALAQFWGRRVGAEAALVGAAASAGDDPFPHLLLARARLAGYAAMAIARMEQFSTHTARAARFAEPPRLAEVRQAAAAALAKALACPAASQLLEGREYVAWAGAAAALADGRAEAAAALLAPLTDDPQLGGAAGSLLGMAEFTCGRFHEAAIAWERLVTRGWAQAYLGAALARLALATGSAAEGVDPDAELEVVAHHLAAALAAHPDWGDALGVRATWAIARARRAIATGGDPFPALDAALRDLEAATPASADPVLVDANRALVWWMRGEQELGRGADPRGSYRRALAAAEAGLAIAPDDLGLRDNRGLAHVGLAQAAARVGEDPMPHYVAALADFAAGPPDRPDAADAANRRGLVHLGIGQARRAAGADARDAYASALDELDRALRLDPAHFFARANRAIARHESATLGSEAGQDPRPRLREALEDYAAAVAREPGHATLRCNRANTWIALADAEARERGDPEPAFAEAEADLREALRLAPDIVHVHHQIGLLAQQRAGHARATGRDPRPWLAQALGALEATLVRDPRHWRALASRGQVFCALGRFDEGLADLEGALRLAPTQAWLADELARARAARDG